MRLRKKDLGPLTLLAEGGFGKVFRVEKFHLPGDPTALAYKEFTVDIDTQAQAAPATVAFRDGLSDDDRAELDRYSAWPRALVEDSHGDVIGLVMQLVPDDFFCRLADPKTGAMTSKPCKMEWLIASDAQRNAAQLDLPEISDTDRLILLGQLVYIIGRLHKHGWVYGDISFNNAVFALNPARMMLVDCDGAAPLNDLNRSQGSTPFWDPPECPISAPGQLQDNVSDVYKLGLAILRCMSPGKFAATDRGLARLAGNLDAEGTALIGRALSTARGPRPPAKELYDYFYRLVSALIAPPDVLAATLVTPLCVRGQDARIEWQIENSAKVIVQAGLSQQFEVDLASHPKGCVFRPEESGPVVIEVSNQYGTASADLGELMLYELPPFTVDLSDLPKPHVPALEAFTLEPMQAILDTPPRVPATEMPPVPTLDIPPVPSLHTCDLIEILTPDWAATMALPQFGDVITNAWSDLASVVESETAEYAATWRQEFTGDQE